MTFIAGLRHDGMTAWVLDGPMDGPAFITYIKTQLAPTLQKGDVVVMDNLPAHKVAAANAAIRERGAWLLFLPPYSPDLNRAGKAQSTHEEIGRENRCLWKGVGKSSNCSQNRNVQTSFRIWRNALNPDLNIELTVIGP